MNKATKQFSRSLAIIVIITFVVTSAIPAGAISVSPSSVSVKVGSEVETSNSTSAKIINKVKETTKKVLDSIGILSENKKGNGTEESNEAIARRLAVDSRVDSRIKEKIQLSLKMNTLDREMLLDIEDRISKYVTAPNFHNKRKIISNIANIGDNAFMGGTGFDTMYGSQKSFFEDFNDWIISEVEVYDSNFIVVSGSYKNGSEARVAVYNGESWIFTDLDIPSDLNFMEIETSLILSRNDIYLGANGGAIYHYNGTNWQLQNTYPDGHTSIRRFVKTETGQMYAVADGAIIWKKETNNSWTPIDVSHDGFLPPRHSFDWDADYYDGKIYFVSDNNVGRVSLMSYDTSLGSTSILVENLDNQRNRYVFGIYVGSEEAIYMTASTRNEPAERGTTLVFKYDGVNVRKIIGSMCENLDSTVFHDIKKDPKRNDTLWVVGEPGALGVVDMSSDTLTMEPVDLNGDGKRDTEDWIVVKDIFLRPNEMYITMHFYMPDKSSIIKFGQTLGLKIDFENLKSVYKSGEEMDVLLKIDNLAGNYEEVDVYVAMEISGDPNLYYFWPTWREELNRRNIKLASGTVTSESILNFVLPDNLPVFGPVKLYAILTAPGNFGIFSNVEVEEFSLAP